MDLSIIKHTEDMMGYGYQCLRQFPKSEKHVLGADIRHCMIDFLGLIVRCGKRYHKKVSLQDADIQLEVLRRLIRLAKDLGFICMRHYENWSKHIAEVGNMLGGWIRSSS